MFILKYYLLEIKTFALVPELEMYFPRFEKIEDRGCCHVSMFDNVRANFRELPFFNITAAGRGFVQLIHSTRNHSFIPSSQQGLAL